MEAMGAGLNEMMIEYDPIAGSSDRKHWQSSLIHLQDEVKRMSTPAEAAITPEIFDHLVKLAALELSPEEAVYLRQQLNKQLKAIRELEAIPLDIDTPIAAHGVPYPREIRQPPRADIWQAYPDVEALLAQAPELEDRYVVVPEIPHEELE